MIYFIISVVVAIVIGGAAYLISSVFTKNQIVRQWVFVGVGVVTLISTCTRSSDTDKDCSNFGSYEQGYAAGEISKMTSTDQNCDIWAEKYNYGTGRDMLTASECFCQGFYDALYKGHNRYTKE